MRYQPLYKIAKELQWLHPEKYGQSKLIVMMGALHIEMAIDSVFGDVLQCSGWSQALSQSSIFTSGRADALEKGSNVNRSRYAYEITLLALEDLREKAFKQYCLENQQLPDDIDIESWSKVQERNFPNFAYWNLVRRLIILHLVFVKSIRSQNFTLYLETLLKIVPLFFALDHPNYARWLSVHIMDLSNLSMLAPTVLSEFLAGKFVITTTGIPFSVPLDQANEFNIKKLKNAGGIIGLTQDPQALRRLMVTGPEIITMIDEYKDDHKFNPKHHESNQSFQQKFRTNLRQLMTHYSNGEIHFQIKMTNYLRLIQVVLLKIKVIESIHLMENIGKQQFDQFVKDRLVDQVTPIHSPIHQNKLALFATINTSSTINKEVLTWTTSSAMKITHFHHLCLIMEIY